MIIQTFLSFAFVVFAEDIIAKSLPHSTKHVLPNSAHFPSPKHHDNCSLSTAKPSFSDSLTPEITHTSTGQSIVVASHTSSPDLDSGPRSTFRTFTRPRVVTRTIAKATSPTGSAAFGIFANSSSGGIPSDSNYTVLSSNRTVIWSSRDVYHTYSGDGSVGAGWPSMAQWMNFTYMFDYNRPNMKISCAQFGVPNNSDREITDLHRAILTASQNATMDPRFILAVVLQESEACVRAPTTQSTQNNPGLMQSFDGSGTCNSNGIVQNPCPAKEIHQMIVDGAWGTPSGPGLAQDYKIQGFNGTMGYYRTARIYNSGSLSSDNNLSGGGSTTSYASDIANRLTGWAYSPHTFSPST